MNRRLSSRLRLHEPRVDGCDKIIELKRPVMAVTVYKKRRGAIDPAPHAAEEIVPDPRSIFVVAQRGVQSRRG